MKDLGTKGGTLYCNQGCLDIVRHFVVTPYVEHCYKVEFKINTYIALAMLLLNYVHWTQQTELLDFTAAQKGLPNFTARSSQQCGTTQYAAVAGDTTSLSQDKSP